MNCVVVNIDGAPVRVQLGGGISEVSPTERELLGELVRCAQAQQAACPDCENPRRCCMEHRTHRQQGYPHTNCILR